ncbi:MAG: RidA family protein [Chlorobium sp.]|nr:RidA family protein [Chlorobium sp.]MCW8820498.1 RidA family protein [Ignavibacteriaceae bacterium]
MSEIETRLRNAGILLPETPTPAGIYVPALRSGGLVYTSGQLPFVGGSLLEQGGRGKVNEINQAQAAIAARVATLNALAAVKGAVGSLDAVERVLKLTVYVASESFFSNQHIVANGASAVLYEAFGENGKHVRSAVGVAELPLDASVELELVVSCSD